MSVKTNTTTVESIWRGDAAHTLLSSVLPSGVAARRSPATLPAVTKSPRGSLGRGVPCVGARATAFLVAGASARTQASVMTTPSSPQVAAAILVFGAISLGWLAMWRLVLYKIPAVRAMAGLQQLPPSPKKSK